MNLGSSLKGNRTISKTLEMLRDGLGTRKELEYQPHTCRCWVRHSWRRYSRRRREDFDIVNVERAAARHFYGQGVHSIWVQIAASPDRDTLQRRTVRQNGADVLGELVQVDRRIGTLGPHCAIVCDRGA